MNEIRVKQSTSERLKRHANPEDTDDAVINRALDALKRRETHAEQKETAKVKVAAVERQIDPRRPVDPRALPDLRHTKIQTASVAGQTVHKPYWGKLLSKVLIHAIKKDPSIREVREVQRAMVRGRKEDKGFHYHAEADISIRGLNVNDVCELLVVVSERLGLELYVIFEWRQKEQAMYPGGRGLLRLDGQPTSG